MALDKNFTPSAGDIPFDTQSGIVPGSSNLNDAPPASDNHSTIGIPPYDKNRWSTYDDYYNYLRKHYNLNIIKVSPNGDTEQMNGVGGQTPGQPDGITDTGVDVALNTGKQPDFPIWLPDETKTPEENLQSLSNWLSGMLRYFTFSNFDYGSPALNYGNTLQLIYDSLSNIGPLKDLSDSATIELAEKISDTLFTYITGTYQSALSYQSWYLQQEYNSPINQIKRLSDAGLNTAFALGNLSSGNAQQPASVPQISTPNASNAGQAEQAVNQSAFGLIGSLVSTAASFIPGAGGAIASLVSSVATKQLSAKQAQLAGSEVVNNAATFEILRQNLSDMKSITAYRDFDHAMQLSQQNLNNERFAVESSKGAYESAMLLGTQIEKFEAYRTIVEDKYGHQKTYDIDVNDMELLAQNNWVTKDGFKVVGVESSTTGATGGVHTSVDIPLVGKAGVNGSVNHSDTSSNTDEKSGSEEKSNSIGSRNKFSHSYYSENGTEFHVGNATFTRVMSEKRVTLQQHKDYIDKCLERYNKALNNYNVLSTGERARLLDMLDNLQTSLASFSSKVDYQVYINKINQLFKPLEFQGD